MKNKYEILDLSKNPRDLRAGDMVKLKKGLRVGRRYGGFTFYKSMRFRYYKVVEGISMSHSVIINMSDKTDDWRYYFPKIMIDLTCVKRYKDEETI